MAVGDESCSNMAPGLVCRLHPHAALSDKAAGDKAASNPSLNSKGALHLLKNPLCAIAPGRHRVPSSQMFGLILAGDQTKPYKITVCLVPAGPVSEAAWPINHTSQQCLLQRPELQYQCAGRST